MAPAVSKARLLGNVRLPDGRGALEAGAEVMARCESVPTMPEDVPDRWRTVPVQVTVLLPGFRDLVFDYLLDGDAEPRVLEAME